MKTISELINKTDHHTKEEIYEIEEFLKAHAVLVHKIDQVGIKSKKKAFFAMKVQ